jgi:FkbM family methyltransferase
MLILNHIEEFEEFYGLLKDEPSRSLMIKLLVFRVLGGRRVKLPTNTPHYWKSVRTIERLMKKPHTIAIPSLSGYLDYYELKEIDLPIRLHGHPLNILNTFLLQQYGYQRKDGPIEVELGDFVIDAGSCWGDVALNFAHKVGKGGKVFCFEFSPHNLAILNQNLDLNDCLKDRIEIIPEALWDKSGEKISYSEKGQATRLIPDQVRLSQVNTRSIDDFMKETGVERIDFIKMDIEGAELRALQGAEDTIRTFRPKLAISLYHNDDDFIVIPKYLDSLKLGYEFFLGHFTIHLEETVLFAYPPR